MEQFRVETVFSWNSFGLGQFLVETVPGWDSFGLEQFRVGIVFKLEQFRAGTVLGWTYDAPCCFLGSDCFLILFASCSNICAIPSNNSGHP